MTNPRATKGGGGRKRLLEAAVRLIGQQGPDVSLRAIAEEAQVSWGLIRCYFGSKEGLRSAAEELVVQRYLGLVHQAADVRSVDDLRRTLDVELPNFEELVDAYRFLRRAIVEDWPIARDFLRDLIARSSEGQPVPPADFPEEHWLQDPVRRVATRMGYLLLAPQIQAILGRDVLSRAELIIRNMDDRRIEDLLRLGLAAEQVAS